MPLFTLCYDCSDRITSPLSNFQFVVVFFLSVFPSHWLFAIPGLHFLTPISKTKVQFMSSQLGFFFFFFCSGGDTQWLAVNPLAKTILRAYPKETLESINTPCPCLLSVPGCAKATSPSSIIDLFGPHLREGGTLFPRVLKCFALAFHHRQNELVPVAALPQLTALSSLNNKHCKL